MSALAALPIDLDPAVAQSARDALKRAHDRGYAEGAAWAAERSTYLIELARREGAQQAADAIYAAVTAGVRQFRDHPGASAIEGEFVEPELRSAKP